MTPVRRRAVGRSPGSGAPAALSGVLVLLLAGTACSAGGTPVSSAEVVRPTPASPAATAPRPVATASATPTPRPPAVPRPVGPVLRGNFPDPDILRDGDTYYAYATNGRGHNVPVAMAGSVHGPWIPQSADSLPRLGAWAEPGYTWAPEVVRRPDGVFVLYYTAASRRTGDQCIGVATASTPRGPFQPVGDRPLVCSARGDAIDAAFFRDTDGEPYLLYRADQAGPRPTAIFVRPLGDRWLGFKGAATRILTWDDSDPILVEAPALVRRGGHYVLFYSSGVFYSEEYRTRYATATRLTGPYRRAPGTLLSTDAYDREVIGPGGADIVQDEAGDHIVFHGITASSGNQRVTRSMYVAALGWDGRRPVVRGVPQRYEAEHADAVAGKSVLRPRASGDRAIDLYRGPGSKLEMKVFAPEAGVYTARLKYRLKWPRPVRAVLAVPDAPGTAGLSEVTLPYGGSPVSWPVAKTYLTLRQGWNTVSLQGLTAAVEVDRLEVR
ncbi:Glycosyl hydrolases family 43 [Thermomonospora echinospora]|uniref:Glycosyl hydrolases family 43 n=2 Tax=Thermomonospora echinospora TaxID=1992 RepID=A0A1H6D4F4_9ACTN|nr:Glycosyl hydrolases family 43 [Thermomonospora echinospora]